MNKINTSFINELEKISGVGLIGDVLAASLIASLAMTGAQHGKGMIEARKAGAKFKEILKAHPLPVGEEWKYRPLTKTNRQFKIPTEHIATPFKETTPYEFTIKKQQDLARTIGMPTGAVFNKLTQINKPTKNKNEK